MTQTFTVPLYLRVGVKRPKNVWLNLSNYRNWQHHQNNDYKKKFKQAISLELQGLKKMEGIVDFKIEVYYPTRLKRDLDNSMSVLTKYTLDALVESGILPEDNIDHIRSIYGRFGGFDKQRPRAVITLSSEDTEDR